MKSKILVLSLVLSASLSYASVFSCPQEEAQFSGNVKNANDVVFFDGSLGCAYQLSFSGVYNLHSKCPLKEDIAQNAILFEEGSCSSNGLVVGEYKSGVLVKRANYFFID